MTENKTMCMLDGQIVPVQYHAAGQLNFDPYNYTGFDYIGSGTIHSYSRNGNIKFYKSNQKFSFFIAKHA